MHNDPIADLLNNLRRGQEAVRKATVSVRAVRDPHVPGRRIYRLTGLDKRAVQHAIDVRMREAEDAPLGGMATFENPWLQRDGIWCSRGEVVIAQPETV